MPSTLRESARVWSRARCPAGLAGVGHDREFGEEFAQRFDRFAQIGFGVGAGVDRREQVVPTPTSRSAAMTIPTVAAVSGAL